MTPRRDVLEWLLAGDPAVAWSATRHLLQRDDPGLRARIATEGDGAALLAARGPDGHWGRGFYQPKWTSSHYTLLELRNLGLAPDNPAATETVQLVLSQEKGPDGGLDPSHRSEVSDVCINGMALDYASYFRAGEEQLTGIVDVILSRRVADGGFNCRHHPPKAPASHSSLHSTVSVVEGLTGFLAAGHQHRRDEVEEARASAVEFILRHELFRSERTGEPIHPDLLVLHHPPRWHFDILRGLACLADAGVPRDPRMGAALAELVAKRRRDGRWTARAWPGETHLPPAPRGPSPWATLTALRVLEAYGA